MLRSIEKGFIVCRVCPYELLRWGLVNRTRFLCRRLNVPGRCWHVPGSISAQRGMKYRPCGWPRTHSLTILQVGHLTIYFDIRMSYKKCWRIEGLNTVRWGQHR